MASPAIAKQHLESLDPATGEAIAGFEITPIATLPAIVARARAAQSQWAELSPRKRAPAIGRLRDAIYQRRSEIADVVTREAGKPRVEALFADVTVALDTAAYYAKPGRVARMLRPQRVPHHNIAVKSKRGQMRFEPYGVIAIISPWNYPIAIPFGQIIPALIAGNAIILKPSEFTPWCGALAGKICQAAGLPDGLVQVAQGAGDLGAALVESDGIGKVIFTGSVATGKRVAEACARWLVPSVLELGGKDAMLVLADADLEIASSAAVWGGFTNCGQACLSVERIYAEQPVAQRFTELCVAKARKLKLGHGGDPGTDIGPMIRAQQVERVERQLRDAVERGAQILTGGRRSPLGGNFFEPTVVAGVDHSMELMREETFGPVIAICPVADAGEAVRLANDAQFGLGASVWTRDAQRGRQIASQLNAGAVMVNDVISAFGICEAPHGGRGASGWGRTHSHLGMLEVVQVKYVDVEGLSRMPKLWWYGYGAGLAADAERFLEFLFAPRWWERLRRTPHALRALGRGNRV
ncbi:MAG: aldehyde dehydrogenase family protein [Candidatus Acidiferrales bacterium]